MWGQNLTHSSRVFLWEWDGEMGKREVGGGGEPRLGGWGSYQWKEKAVGSPEGLTSCTGHFNTWLS